MTHSYLLVISEGNIQRVDSDGPITGTEIRIRLGGEFESFEWEALNLVLTVCFNSGGAQLGLPTNRKFKGKCGDVLIGVYERGTFRGLTDEEFQALLNFISDSL